VYVVLAVLLVALGGFTAVVASRVRPDPGRLRLEQLRGFCYVGAVAVGVLGVAVVILGWVTRDGRLAESVALLGFFGYLVYQLAALVIITWPAGRWPRRTIPPVHRRNRSQNDRDQGEQPTG
jgi:hypothetical protein